MRRPKSTEEDDLLRFEMVMYGSHVTVCIHVVSADCSVCGTVLCAGNTRSCTCCIMCVRVMNPR